MVKAQTSRILLFTLLLLVGCGLSCAKGVKSRAVKRVSPRVFVNPGHGGHNANDRNEPFMQFAEGDTLGFWESNSNLAKGNALVGFLRDKGYEVFTSRTTNTTEDDLDLFEVCQLAANSGADLFLAIHSNDTGVEKRVNYTAQLYRGFTDTACVPQSVEFAKLVSKRLCGNQCTEWTTDPIVAGDWSFFYDWGYKVGLSVLRYNKLPAMLSEGSFQDYIPERQRLLNNGYCALEAWNFSLAIDDYFNYQPKSQKGFLAGVLRYSNVNRPDTCQLFGQDTLEAVNSAKVSLMKGKKVIATCTTDTLHNGFYCFKNVKPGKYVLRIDYLQDHHISDVLIYYEDKFPIVVRRKGTTYFNKEFSASEFGIRPYVF